MMPMSAFSPSFNYRRNTYPFSYTSNKNFATHISPNTYSPNNSTPHNIVKSNNKNYSHTTNNNFHSSNMRANSSFSNCDKPDCKIDNKTKEESENRSYEQFFEIFGIKLYFDDLLILALLFFLYKEEVNDINLFIILFMLLLN